MTPHEFQAKYPLILNWIHQTLAAHTPNAKPLTAYKFPRLSHYFSQPTLASAKVIPVETVPLPPLSAMGLSQFSAFEHMPANGITYLDTYFVRQELANDEELHFHELIHIIQWRILGPERFLALYADGLERFGYRNSPLEAMAYQATETFQNSPHPFDAEALVKAALTTKT